MSLVLLRTGKPQEALEAVNTALKMNPESALGNASMAALLYDQGKYRQSLTFVNKAIDLWPKNPNCYFLRSEIYSKLRNRDLAFKDLQQSCKMGFPRACKRLDMIKQRMPPRARPGDKDVMK